MVVYLWVLFVMALAVERRNEQDEEEIVVDHPARVLVDADFSNGIVLDGQANVTG